MSIVWAYGVTTVPSRISSGLLNRTLESLSKAGFSEPQLFIDGIPTEMLGTSITNLRVTCHSPEIRIYGNFHLALSELFIRSPEADYYAMFQDDLVAYPHLREYLEACTYPKKGYLNLFTFKENERDISGWYPSNQLGKGAVALVFNKEATKTLLESPTWINKPDPKAKASPRNWKYIDGGIVNALMKQGYKEYVHNPSLVQHVGEKSTVGNAKHPGADTFKGEDFDARLLIPKEPKVLKRGGRIGLVGYSTASGIGEVNRQLAEYADIYKWLIKPHAVFPTLEPTSDVDWTTCPIGAKAEDFVKSVDIVLFVEVPYYSNLLELCGKYKKRVVCIPMMEWMPVDLSSWPKNVDLFICPTKQCYDLFCNLLPCTYFPWPVDLSRFEFRQRNVCNRFLFINGHGGWKGRKGASVIQEVLAQWPDIPITIYDQSHTKWGVPTTPAPKNNADLYKEGDVLITPHSVDGIGLEAMEAMASGIPVISTDGLPWNELPSLARIQSTVDMRPVRRKVSWHIPSSESLLQLCREWLGKDISEHSLKARQWAEDNAWSGRAKEFDLVVRTANPTVSKPQVEAEVIPIVKTQQLKPRVNVQDRWDKFLFDEALHELKRLGGSVIVELGAIRDTKPIARRSDGWSTVHWANSDFEAHCVDNDPKAIAIAKQLVSKNVHYHLQDGFMFLSQFNKPIDLLYLDGPDANLGGQEFHLKALIAAKLADKCLLLMDDCDLWPERWRGRGKGELAIPKALEMGFKILKDNDRQVLMVRE